MNTFKKDISLHTDFYIAKFTKNPALPYLLFIHGGPGSNCGIIEYLIEHNDLFGCLLNNIILYDQRNCGRSRNYTGNILHQDNVDDLQKIILHLTKSKEVNICGLIGHSYGAKILFDYYHKFHSTIPGIFISTAPSILTPRLNNLILDLSYLKKSNPEQYNEILQEMDSFDLKKLIALTDKLNPLFNKNTERPYLYWANLDLYTMVKEIQAQINLPNNNETFNDIRKDLYSNESNYTNDISNIGIPHLWINGFHDFIMNGSEGILSKNPAITTFYKSSHYPHIEENNRFSELINEFLKNL